MVALYKDSRSKVYFIYDSINSKVNNTKRCQQEKNVKKILDKKENITLLFHP